MIRKFVVLLAMLVCLGVLASCSQERNDATVTTENADEYFCLVADYDTTSDTIESNNDICATETEAKTFGNIYLNPDGEEFAKHFGSFDVDYKDPIVQYWDTGKVVVKFETFTDSDSGHIFKINNRTIDCLHVNFRQILVEDEYIIVITGGTDINTFPIYIFDYNGNTLFKTYYLSNSGMVNEGAVTVVDNKIIIRGTRITHGPSIMIGCNKLWQDGFSDYSNYLYEDTVYDYGDNFQSYDEVFLDESNYEKIKILNPNEKTDAVFEMKYLGNGEFSKILITDRFRTLKELYSQVVE